MPAAAVTIIGVKVQRVQQRPDLRPFAQYDVPGLDHVKEPPGQSGPRLIVVGQECRALQAVQMPPAVCALRSRNRAFLALRNARGTSGVYADASDSIRRRFCAEVRRPIRSR